MGSSYASLVCSLVTKQLQCPKITCSETEIDQRYTAWTRWPVCMLGVLLCWLTGVGGKFAEMLVVKSKNSEKIIIFITFFFQSSFYLDKAWIQINGSWLWNVQKRMYPLIITLGSVLCPEPCRRRAERLLSVSCSGRLLCWLPGKLH